MKIQLDHLTKKFKNTVAVCDMNCTIEDGEMVCLLGLPVVEKVQHYR